MHLTPFLLFDGNCAEAMDFYQSCLGGELTVTRLRDTPMGTGAAPSLQHRVVYARLKADALEFSATDWLHPTRAPTRGNTVAVHLEAEDYGSLQATFDKLAVGGDAALLDDLRDMPFGSYGHLADRYGVHWFFKGPLRGEMPAGAVPECVLRPVEASDLDAIFEQMRDPDSVRMAAFTAEDPGDRGAFDAHMARIMASSENRLRAVICDARLVGTISSYVSDGATEVTYWIDRSCWGRGFATRALGLLLHETAVRPIRARAASDNAASLRVLQKAGFRPVGTEVSFAPGRAVEIEETILELP